MEPRSNVSAYEAAYNLLDKMFTGGPARFHEGDWFYSGSHYIPCPDCSGPTHSFCRAYIGRLGEDRLYRALACLRCERLFAPDRLSDVDRRMLYRLSGEFVQLYGDGSSDPFVEPGAGDRHRG